MTQTEIATAVSRGQGHVSKRLALLKLPQSGLDLVLAGSLNLEDALDIARMPAPIRDGVLDALDRGLSAELAVGNARTKVAELADRAAAAKALKAAGTTFVDAAKTAVPEGLVRLQSGVLYAVSPADHTECPGRVVVLAARRDWGGWIHEYCSTPDVHREVPSSRVDAAREAQLAARAASEAIANGHAERRHAFLVTLFAAKLPRLTQEWLNRFAVIGGLIGYRVGTDTDDAYLLAAPADVAEMGGSEACLRWAVEQATTAKGDVLQRLSLASWVSVMDGELVEVMQGRDYAASAMLPVYLQFLAAAGYEADPIELEFAGRNADLATEAGVVPEVPGEPLITTVADIDEYETPDDAPLEPAADAHLDDPDGDPLDDVS
jgi:hypothetical protein